MKSKEFLKMDAAQNTRLHTIRVNDAELEMIKQHRAQITLETRRAQVKGAIFAWLPRCVNFEQEHCCALEFGGFVNLFDGEFDQLQDMPRHAAYGLLKTLIDTANDEIGKWVR